MTRQIHAVIKNPDNFDHIAANGAIHDEMPATTAFSRDMKRPKIGKNFIAGDASEDIGASFERGKSLEQCHPVDRKAALTEFVFRRLQNVREIHFRHIAKANAPARLCQLSPAPEAM